MTQLRVCNALERSRQDGPGAPSRQQSSGYLGNLFPTGDNLFRQDKGGQSGDPHQVHHSQDEQQRHQDPTASQAISTMLQTHLERPAGPFSPIGHQET